MCEFHKEYPLKFEKEESKISGMYGKILGIIKEGDPAEGTETRYLVSVPPIGNFDIPESAMSAVNEPMYLLKLDTGEKAWLPESYLEPVEE